VYAIISILVMFYDQRHGWLEAVRFFLTSTIAYPVQTVVSSPGSAWHWLQGSFETRDALRAENERLKAQDRALAIRSMRFEALEHENAELRGLRDGLPPLVDHWIAAEIMNIEVDNLRQRVVISRGTTNGVFKAQTVIDDKGVIGQTTHVGLLSSEIILITDPEHAIPVEVQRTGLRTIAVGAGDMASLALPYLPGNADLKPGDILVTSGLGGVFPAGYPVATVAEVHRDAVQPLAQVRATPFANIESDREVALVWFQEDNPAAPTPEANAARDLSKGNAKLKPQPAPPPKPKPAPAEAAPAPTAPQTTPGAQSSGTAQRNSPPASGGVKAPAARTPSNPASKPPQPTPPAPSPDATPRTP
jgi:rod shape-determining protein MreC